MNSTPKTLLCFLAGVLIGVMLMGCLIKIDNDKIRSPYIESSAKVNRNLSITEDADYPDTVLVFRHEGDVCINKLHNEDNVILK